VWLDNATCNALVAGRITDIATEFIRSCDACAQDGMPERGGYRSMDRPGGRPRCPVCEHALEPVEAADGVEVDMCADHGTFFDRLEVSEMRFAQAMELEQTRVRVQLGVIAERAELDAFHEALGAPSDDGVFPRRRLPFLLEALFVRMVRRPRS